MTWDRFKSLYYTNPRLGLSLDISRMPFPDDFLGSMEPRLKQAFADMAALEGGAIANPDEKRMVGHYWLRDAELAPNAELKAAITSTLDAIKAFVTKVHKGELTGTSGVKFKEVLVIGIGGSALGPQLVSHALGRLKGNRDKMGVSFFDNTDPDGIDYVLKTLGSRLKQTLVIVISKSGGTAETRNGMLEAQVAFKAAGLDFPKHFVLLALMWHWATNGKGMKDMVVLPYKDRLLLLSRYLQQLVMESLGKEHDRQGKVVNQGIAVYGNKGSTDQHAYVQQLRDGRHDFFATFIEVLQAIATDTSLRGRAGRHLVATTFRASCSRHAQGAERQRTASPSP
jgi:glucose-6-phosphate isomerase